MTSQCLLMISHFVLNTSQCFWWQVNILVTSRCLEMISQCFVVTRHCLLMTSQCLIMSSQSVLVNNQCLLETSPSLLVTNPCLLKTIQCLLGKANVYWWTVTAYWWLSMFYDNQSVCIDHQLMLIDDQSMFIGDYIQRRVQADERYFTLQITGINFECSLWCNSTVIVCIALLLHIIWWEIWLPNYHALDHISATVFCVTEQPPIHM